MAERAAFTNRLVFNRVVCNESVCRKLIRALVGIEVDEISYINAEQSWEPAPGDRGVRMDVVARADGRTIDLEMQVARERHMGRRLRYYQGAMDTAALAPGDRFTELPESHIVFICLDDPFSLGCPVYTLDIFCEEAPELDSNVGMRWHVLNAAAWESEPDAEVREVLHYAKEGVATGALTREIDSLVDSYNNDGKWVRRVLTWAEDTEIQCEYAREEGIEIGRAEGEKIGLERGIEQGANRFADLVSRLVAEGRAGEVIKVAEDRELRERLFEEFCL